MTILRVTQCIAGNWCHILDLPVDRPSPYGSDSPPEFRLVSLAHRASEEDWIVLQNEEAKCMAVFSRQHGPLRFEILEASREGFDAYERSGYWPGALTQRRPCCSQGALAPRETEGLTVSCGSTVVAPEKQRPLMAA